VIAEVDKNLLLAARNIPTVLVQRVWDLNTYSLLNAKNVIFTDAAVKALTAPPAAQAEAKAPKAAKTEAKAAPKAAKPKAPAKPKAAKAGKA